MLEVLHFSLLLFDLGLSEGVLLLLLLDLLQSLSNKELLLLSQARQAGLASCSLSTLQGLLGLLCFLVFVGVRYLALRFHWTRVIGDEVVDLWQATAHQVALPGPWATSAAVPVPPVPPLLHVHLFN